MWKRKFDDSTIVKASETTRNAINTAATNTIQSNRANFSIQLRNSSNKQTNLSTSPEKLYSSKENINNKLKKCKHIDKETEKVVENVKMTIKNSFHEPQNGFNQKELLKLKMVEKSRVDEINFNANESLVEQLIRNLNEETVECGKMSTKAENVNENQTYLSKFDNTTRQQLVANYAPIQTHFPSFELKISRMFGNETSICEKLIKMNCQLAPFECFLHVQNDLNNRSASTGYSPNTSSNSFLKFEFVYSPKYYCLIKLRKYLNNLYQMKFVDEDTLNDSTMQNLNLSSDLNETAESTNPAYTPGNFNQIYFIHMDKSSKLSMFILRHLKPLGWSKKAPNNARIYRRPNSFFKSKKNDLTDLISFVRKCYENSDSTSKEEELISLELDMDLFPNPMSSSSSYSSLTSLFQANAFFELQQSMYPRNVNTVKIKRNVGGRLLFDDPNYANVNSENSSNWLFYLDPRIHPCGWAKSNHYNLLNKQIAFTASTQSLTELNDSFSGPRVSNLNSSLDDLNQSNSQLFQNNPSANQHNQTFLNDEDEDNQSVSSSLIIQDHGLRHKQHFELNDYMECMYRNKFYVARVCEILNEVYFKIELDSVDALVHKTQLVYNVNNVNSLFPCKWCQINNLNLVPPSDWTIANTSLTEFDWDIYISKLNQNELAQIYKQVNDVQLFSWSRHPFVQLSEKFQLGMYLECVHPLNKSYIFLAQIKAKIYHLLFLKLLNVKFDLENFQNSNATEVNENQDELAIYSCDSMDIYPVGWCEMNNFYEDSADYKRIFYLEPRVQSNPNLRDDFFSIPLLASYKSSKNWCEKIHLNINVNCGPYFSMSKLTNLPKSFGPGPIPIVIYDIIHKLINICEKPCKLLKILHQSRKNRNTSTFGPLNKLVSSKFMHRFRFKASENGKALYKELEICTEQEQLSEYLDDLCHKFKCCTRMLSIEPMQLNVVADVQSCLKNKPYANFKCCTWCSLNYFNDCNRNDANKISESHRSNLYLRQPFKKVSMSIGNSSANTNKSVFKLKKVKRKSDQVNASSTIKTRSSNERHNLITSAKLQQELIECEKQQIERVKLKSKLEQRQLLKFNKKKQQQEHKRQQKLENNSKRAMLKKSDKPIKDVLKTNKNKINKQNKSMENIKISSKVETNDSFAVSPSKQTPSLNVSLPTSTSFNLMNNQSTLLNNSSVSNLDYSHKSDTQKNSYISNANMANICNETKTSNLSNGFVYNEPAIEVKSNPIYWTISDVCKYLLENEFDSNLVYLIEEHEIDGQSFLMLSLPTMLNYMKLKLGPALKLADIVFKLKQVYIQKYKNEDNKPNLASTPR
jgi:hypothetical protein